MKCLGLGGNVCPKACHAAHLIDSLSTIHEILGSVPQHHVRLGVSQAVVVHAFNPSTWEAEASRSL